MKSAANPNMIGSASHLWRHFEIDPNHPAGWNMSFYQNVGVFLCRRRRFFCRVDACRMFCLVMFGGKRFGETNYYFCEFAGVGRVVSGIAYDDAVSVGGPMSLFVVLITEGIAISFVFPGADGRRRAIGRHGLSEVIDDGDRSRGGLRLERPDWTSAPPIERGLTARASPWAGARGNTTRAGTATPRGWRSRFPCCPLGREEGPV